MIVGYNYLILEHSTDFIVCNYTSCIIQKHKLNLKVFLARYIRLNKMIIWCRSEGLLLLGNPYDHGLCLTISPGHSAEMSMIVTRCVQIDTPYVVSQLDWARLQIYRRDESP